MIPSMSERDGTADRWPFETPYRGITNRSQENDIDAVVNDRFKEFSEMRIAKVPAERVIKLRVVFKVRKWREEDRKEDRERRRLACFIVDRSSPHRSRLTLVILELFLKSLKCVVRTRPSTHRDRLT